MIFAFLNQSSTFFSPFAEDCCLFQISSFFGAFFWSMFAQFPKITAHVFGCDFPSLPRKLRLPRPKFCHKFACTCEVSEFAFRDEAGEGCAFPCAAARSLPCFLPLFRCSLFGRASSVFSECFFKRLCPSKKSKQKQKIHEFLMKY